MAVAHRLLPPLGQVPPRAPKLKPSQLSAIHSLSPPFFWSHYSAPSAKRLPRAFDATTSDPRLAPSVYCRLNVPQYMLGGINTQVIPIPPYKLGRMHTCMR